MLRKEDYAVIKALKKRGVYHSDIAAELGIHPRTVSRALKRDGHAIIAQIAPHIHPTAAGSSSDRIPHVWPPRA